MDNDEQKELFEFEKPKKRFAGLSDILPKADLEGRVVFPLTLEKLIFILIGIIMSLVLVYALGVERGKSLKSVQASPLAIRIPQVQAPEVAPKGTITVKMAQAPQGKTLQTAKPLSGAPKIEIPNDIAKPYTIAAVTLSKREFAQNEMNRLKKEGLNAYVVESGSYFVVYVGEYPDKQNSQALKDLNRIKKVYPDAYIKSR